MNVWGAPLHLATAAGYPFLVLIFVGWIWALVRPAR